MNPPRHRLLASSSIAANQHRRIDIAYLRRHGTDVQHQDRIATHILSFEGDSHVEWFEGNFQDYEKDKMRRLGTDTVIPHRIKYKKFSR